jgi:hypothetical protein
VVPRNPLQRGRPADSVVTDLEVQSGAVQMCADAGLHCLEVFDDVDQRSVYGLVVGGPLDDWRRPGMRLPTKPRLDGSAIPA